MTGTFFGEPSRTTAVFFGSDSSPMLCFQPTKGKHACLTGATSNRQHSLSINCTIKVDKHSGTSRAKTASRVSTRQLTYHRGYWPLATGIESLIWLTIRLSQADP